MVYLGRMKDGSRKVLEIVELNGIRDQEVVLNPLYRFREINVAGRTAREQPYKERSMQGIWEKTGSLLHREKLRAAGLSEVSDGL